MISNYDEFIDDGIFKLLGIDDMSENDKEELLKKMFKTIENRVVAKVMDALPDSETEAVKDAVTATNKDKFYEILKRHNINLEKLYAEEALIYKLQMTDLVNIGEENAGK